jgi:hypothetical protein
VQNFFDVPTLGGSSLFLCVLAQNGAISVHTKRTQTIRAVRRNAERTSRLVGTARSLSYLFAHKTARFSCLFQMRANASHGWVQRNVTPLILTYQQCLFSQTDPLFYSFNQSGSNFYFYSFSDNSVKLNKN